MNCLSTPAPALIAQENRARSLTKPIFGTLASNVCLLLLGLGASVILNRALGPEGKGLYATLVTTSQLSAMIASLGVGKSVVFYMANREENQQRVFNTFLFITGLTVLLAFLVSLAIAAFSARLYSGLDLLCLGGLSAFSLLHSSGLGVLRGIKDFKAGNLQNLLANAIFVTTVAALVCAGVALPSSVAACKIFSFGLGAMLIWQRLKGSGFQLTPSFSPALGKRIVSYGLGFFFYALFQNLSYRFDLLLVAHMTSLADAGWYGTATGLTEVIWYFPNAVGTVLFPVVASLDDTARDQLVAKICRWSVWIMALGAAGLIIASPVLVPLLYGDRFVPTVKAIRALSLGIVTNGIFQILGIHLAARKQLPTLTFITGSGFACNLLLNLALIPRFGIVGAGVSSTISYFICGLLTAVVFLRTTGRNWRELLVIPKSEMRTVGEVILKKLRSPVRTPCN